MTTKRFYGTFGQLTNIRGGLIMWNNEERAISYRKAKALERIADNLEKVVELLTELKNGGKDE